MTRTCIGTFSGRWSSPTQSKPNHEHIHAQSFANIGPRAEGQTANGSGPPRVPQYRFILAGDFAGISERTAGRWASTKMTPTAQHERHGYAGQPDKLTNDAKDEASREQCSKGPSTVWSTLPEASSPRTQHSQGLIMSTTNWLSFFQFWGMVFMRWRYRNWNIFPAGGRQLMNLKDIFQWLMLLYGVTCIFVDCCYRHEGEFSSRNLGAFSDFQDPLYMTSVDIEKVHPGHCPIVQSIISQVTVFTGSTSFDLCSRFFPLFSPSLTARSRLNIWFSDGAATVFVIRRKSRGDALLADRELNGGNFFLKHVQFTKICSSSKLAFAFSETRVSVSFPTPSRPYPNSYE
jgi:hypothetical protein